MREALVFTSVFDDPVAWQRALGADLPDLEFRVAPDIGDRARVRYVLA
jgi:glyoxylate/hydroxypyruvate reductase A